MNDIAKSHRWDHLERPRSPVLDGILGRPHPCLDHGFIRLIDYMGNEDAIVQAARVSYGKGTKTRSDDRGLIRYLMKHYHTTPFEMCEIKVHMKLPIFVARQWIRHRTASVNEYSARYSILANEFFIPHPDDIEPQSKTNKQGRDGELPESVRTAMSRTIQQHSEGSYQIYEELLSGWPWMDPSGTLWDDYHDPAERQHAQSIADPSFYKADPQGMARELARMVLPVNAYTEWYWKVDLHNLLHLLRLRVDPHAQREIRVYADTLARLVEMWVPRVWEAFVDYQLEACTFSRMEMQIVRSMIAALRVHEGPPTFALERLTNREIAEFKEKLGMEDAA